MVKKIESDKSEKPSRAVKPNAANPRANSKAPVKASRASASAKTPAKFAKPKDALRKRAEAPQDVKEPKAVKAATAKNTESADEKLQKVLARAGIGSRREMERAIEEGRVKVNDHIAKLGDRVTPKDKIFVDGHRIQVREEASRHVAADPCARMAEHRAAGHLRAGHPAEHRLEALHQRGLGLLELRHLRHGVDDSPVEARRASGRERDRAAPPEGRTGAV